MANLQHTSTILNHFVAPTQGLGGNSSWGLGINTGDDDNNLMIKPEGTDWASHTVDYDYKWLNSNFFDTYSGVADGFPFSGWYLRIYDGTNEEVLKCDNISGTVSSPPVATDYRHLNVSRAQFGTTMVDWSGGGATVEVWDDVPLPYFSQDPVLFEELENTSEIFYGMYVIHTANLLPHGVSSWGLGIPETEDGKSYLFVRPMQNWGGGVAGSNTLGDPLHQWLGSNYFDSHPSFLGAEDLDGDSILDPNPFDGIFLRLYDENDGREEMVLIEDVLITELISGLFVLRVVRGQFETTIEDWTTGGAIVQVLGNSLAPVIQTSFDNSNLTLYYNKKILINKPNAGDISQYNFEADYVDNPPVYEDSIGLPKYHDRFTKKDLYTKCVGDSVNDAIIMKNLKFEGDSAFKIDTMHIQNTGVDGTTISNQVTAWIFSEAAYGGDPTQDGYSTIWSKLKDEYQFYSETFGDRSQGSDIGNITPVEAEPLFSNLSKGVEPIIASFPGQHNTFAVGFPDDVTNDDFNSPISALEISSTTEDTRPSSIFNAMQYNPIYIVIYTKGDKKVAWPINSDSRKTKLSVFKINNGDLYEIVGTEASGKVYQVNFTSPNSTKTAGGGSSNSAVQSAWRVSSLVITINTAGGELNTFNESINYQSEIQQTLPPISINDNTFNSEKWLGLSHPRMQLNNTQPSGFSSQLARHPDFVPFTSFGFSQNNSLGNNYLDLQSYNYDLDLVPKTSIPLNVTFQIDNKSMGIQDGENLSLEDGGDLLFYYFVINWDDKDDEIKTINDWLESRPINTWEYLEKQNENLYKIAKINYTQNTNDGLLSNVYTTPGIKTVKFIMISIWSGETEGPDFEVGRWKLCTSRFYLDIPPNQYPDFSEVGGSDYTTLPWPHTTPIVGGVSQDSKYKISIKDSLSGGNIGDTDIIDEKFLFNDLENDEMGKNIEQMDLEQIRYFNTGSYNMNTLLNIPYESILINRIYNTDELHLYTLEGYNGNGMSDIELGYFHPQQWVNYGRPDIGEYIQSLDENTPRGGSEEWINERTGELYSGPIHYHDGKAMVGARHTSQTHDYLRPVTTGGTGGQIMGNDGGGIFDAGGEIGIEGEQSSFVPQDIAPGQIAGGVGEYLDPPELQIISPAGGEKYQAFDSSFGYIDIVWYRKYFDNNASFNIQLLKKEIDGTLSFVSLITANTQGSPAGQNKRKFRAFLGESTGGFLFNPPAGDNYTIGIFRNTTFESGNISAYMGMDNVSTGFDEYDINDITTFRVVNPQEESPYSFPGDTSTTDADTQQEPFLLITETEDRPLETFANWDYEDVESNIITSYNENYWDGETSQTTFPEESSVGQIFITENQDLDLKESCKLELNTGELTEKTIIDSSGNSNKGLLIGDYKVKKNRKNQPMKRDSFIKVPTKTGNDRGAL